MEVLRAFLDVSIAVEASDEDQSCCVRIAPPE
jgi:hypothetical protein